MEMIKAFLQWLMDYLKAKPSTPAVAQATESVSVKLPWDKPEWTTHLVRLIEKSKLPDLEMADADAFMPGFSNLDRNGRVKFFAHLFCKMAWFESKWNPKAKLVEDMKNRAGNPVVSTGLLQVSKESSHGYGFDGDLEDPLENLRAGVMIAEKLIAKAGRLQGAPNDEWIGLSAYWSTMRIKNAPYDQIKTYMRSLKLGGNVPAPAKTISRSIVADRILTIIKADIDANLRETNGSNRSKRIDEFNHRVGAPLGTPYCAAGGWCAIDDACKALGLKNPVPRTASSQAMFTNVPAKYRKQIGGKRGDGAIFTNRNDSSHGHYTTVSGDQSGIKFQTYEYNTNLAGDREGDGAFVKTRTTAGDPSKKFRGFVDIPQWILDHNGVK